MMEFALLLSIVWIGVFALARLMVPARAAALGATGMLALLGGQVVSADFGLWWGEVVSLTGVAGILGFLVLTVRLRIG